MNKRFLYMTMVSLVLSVGSLCAQHSMQRIDREIQKTVFIPKGTWMAGGTFSYSEHDETNLNFLVLKNVEGNGYDFTVSPYFGYFFRNNVAKEVSEVGALLPQQRRVRRPICLLAQLPGHGQL